jgi:hypothetical protein
VNLMQTLFPFGFPWPTAMYLTLFIVTAAIYMVFMHYVLAGAIVLSLGYMAPGARRRIEAGTAGQGRSGLGLLLKVIRDWLPAVLGLAITAGVAPLLFLQILYKHEFYTANLLLSNRFMLLLPALIVAYYMLYLLKSQTLAGNGAMARGLASFLAFVCFFYTAWAWTENHVLSLHHELWRSQYTSSGWVFRDAEIWPRLGFWLTTAFPTLAVALGWQLHWGREIHDPISVNLASRRLRGLAILGLATSVAEAWLWQLWLEPAARATVLSLLAGPYAVLALLGMVVQTGCWLLVKSGTDMNARRLTIISAAAAITITSSLVVREARRLAAIDITTLFDAHRQAARVGGMGVFLTFFAVNAGVISACVWIVKRSFPRER